MSLQQLPNGKWRAQVYSDGRNVSVGKVLGGSSVFPTKREAKMARERARERLGTASARGITVAEWVQRWTTDPLYQRPKESTNLHNADRVRRFTETYGDRPLREVGDAEVDAWLRDGRNRSTVPALRAMFNDAASKDAGRLVSANPFAGLKIKRSKGNRHVDPPSEDMVWRLAAAARKQGGPSFGAWFQVAAFTGLRPGELDALRWDSVDFDAGRIRVVEQFNARSKTFTLPKNGLKRVAPLTPPAREALLGAPTGSEFCFVNLQGRHWTSRARDHHWQVARAEVGWDKTLYLATRHFAGWYMRNVLRLDSEDVAVALGHEDGGELVRVLYGHLETDDALARVAKAYESVGKVTRLRAVEGEGA